MSRCQKFGAAPAAARSVWMLAAVPGRVRMGFSQVQPEFSWIYPKLSPLGRSSGSPRASSDRSRQGSPQASRARTSARAFSEPAAKSAVHQPSRARAVGVDDRDAAKVPSLQARPSPGSGCVRRCGRPTRTCAHSRRGDDRNAGSLDDGHDRIALGVRALHAGCASRRPRATSR